MEVGDNGALAIGDGDELIAGALDNGKRNEVVGHWRWIMLVPDTRF